MKGSAYGLTTYILLSSAIYHQFLDKFGEFHSLGTAIQNSVEDVN